MSKSGIVNVRMVITEEKILSNIEKVQKMINPKSKKQILQLEEDTYFKDLIESIKAYLIEYPKKKNFPISVYKAAYGLVEFATNQFEENTKRIEELIRQREKNITLAGQLKELIENVDNKTENWKENVKKAEGNFEEDIIETLNVLGKCKTKKSENYLDAIKLLNARVSNLESNLHIEIDMERIEDRSKALSYIGIEVADALKTIPTPVEEDIVVKEEIENIQAIEDNVQVEEEQQVTENVETMNDVELQDQLKQYIQDNSFDTKPSLWQRFKNSKFVKSIKYIMKIRIVIDYPALPEGKGENY